MKLTKTTIKNHVGSQSYQRGENYWRNNTVFNSRLAENQAGLTVLKADCYGSYDNAYRVQATVSDKQIVSSDCTCPVGGNCKHVAAMLLLWIDNPDAFYESEPVAERLQNYSKEQLIDLIQRMVDREPDLEPLLDMPPPGASVRSTNQLTIDPNTITRQVSNAFNHREGWGAGAAIAQDLEHIIRPGLDYERADEWKNAVAIYATTARTILEQEFLLEIDYNGDIGCVVNDCIDGLDRCLEHITDPAARETILTKLFEIDAWDTRAGGVGMGEMSSTVILNHATPEEKAMVAGWVRNAMPKKQGWARESYGRFLLELEADVIDDEAYLKICRETGRKLDLVDQLLRLNRIDEALAESKTASDYDLLRMADILVGYGYGPIARDLIAERAKMNPDHRLKSWLKEYAKKSGDTATSLIMCEDFFWERPTIDGYDELKTEATRAGLWAEMEPALLKRLEAEEKWSFLTELHLHEQRNNDALDTFKKCPPSTGYLYSYTTPLPLKVAKAVETTHPREAISIYQPEVIRLIDQRGRDNYRTAAGYLVIIKRLFETIDDGATWQQTISHIRATYANLPALQDEIKKAGLAPR